MITVNEAAANYCKQNNLPAPSRNDLTSVGRIIGTHFRLFWGPRQAAEIIAQAGFIMVSEFGRAVMVIRYPDCFAVEMEDRIRVFYENKGKDEEKILVQKIEELKVKRQGSSSREPSGGPVKKRSGKQDAKKKGDTGLSYTVFYEKKK